MEVQNGGMEMMSLEEMRKIEPALKKVTDQELEKARKLLYDLGRLSLECFMESKAGSKYPVRVPGQTKGNTQELKQCKMEKEKKE